MLVLSCDDVPANPLPATGRQAGIDVGVVRYATLSDGTGVDNPRWARAAPTGWRRRSSGCSARSVVRRAVNAGGRRWPPGTVRSPTSARTFTTSRPARSSRGMTFWWWRIYRSPTWFGGQSLSPIPTKPGQFLPNGARAKSGLSKVSVTLAGASSSRFCAPKRKMLGAPGSRSTPGTRRMAARTVGMQPPRIASPKRNSNASDAGIAPRQTSMPHATSSGPDWPVMPKRHEKKLAASSRQRSHSCGIPHWKRPTDLEFAEGTDVRL